MGETMLGSAGSSQVAVLVLTLFLKKRRAGDESTHSRERGTAQSCTLALLFAAAAAAEGLQRFPAQMPMALKFPAWVLTLSAIKAQGQRFAN